MTLTIIPKNQQRAHGVARAIIKYGVPRRNVHFEGLENLVEAQRPVIILEQHNHHTDDAMQLGAAMHDHPELDPPIMLIGSNLYKPLVSYAWEQLGAVPFPRESKGRAEAYAQTKNWLDSGRSVWIASTSGLVKNGCNSVREANFRPLLKMGGYRHAQDLLDDYPVVPVANNSARFIGERLRAKRDAFGKSELFDAKMFVAYFTDDPLVTVVRVGEPITEAGSVEELAFKVNEHAQGRLPLFPEDFEAFFRSEKEGTANRNYLLREHRKRASKYGDFLERVRALDGQSVYRAALRQRTEPVKSWLRWNTGSYSPPGVAALLADEVSRYK